MSCSLGCKNNTNFNLNDKEKTDSNRSLSFFEGIKLLRVPSLQNKFKRIILNNSLKYYQEGTWQLELHRQKFKGGV